MKQFPNRNTWNTTLEKEKMTRKGKRIKKTEGENYRGLIELELQKEE